jgi:hypothetical protein
MCRSLNGGVSQLLTMRDCGLVPRVRSITVGR